MEQIIENQVVSIGQKTIEDRVALSLAIDAHIRAQSRHRAAWESCREASKNLQQMIGPNQRVVAKVDYKYYIVTSDEECGISVDQVECV